MGRSKNISIYKTFAIFAAVCTLTTLPTAVFADAGIPLLSCIYPGFWLILPVIILIEGVVALIVLRRGVWCALKVATISNALSTLIGMPLSKISLAVLSSSAKQAMQFAHRSTLFQKFAFNIVGSPFGLSEHQERWPTEVLCCWIILIIPFFLLSVGTEWWVAKGLLDKESRRLASRWAWCANIASYILIIALFWQLFGITWWWLERQFI